MRVTVIGSSPSFPNPGTPSSGYLVQVEDTALLVDCGHGVGAALQDVKPLDQLSAIVVSHMHPDHFFDLLPLTYAFKYHGLPPIPLHLPPGGPETLSRLQSAVDLSDDFFSCAFQVTEYVPHEGLQAGQVRITFAETRHFIPAWAMRFESARDPDRHLLFSGDTGWTDSVVALARGARLAIVEATLDEHASPGEREGHMTAGGAAKLAREAGVERLVLTHYPQDVAPKLLSQAQEVFGPDVSLAASGQDYRV